MICLSSRRTSPYRPHRSGQYRAGFAAPHPSASYLQRSVRHPAYLRQPHIAGAVASYGCAGPPGQASLSASISLTYQLQGQQSHWPTEILQNPEGTYQSPFPIRQEQISVLFHTPSHPAESRCLSHHSAHQFGKISGRSGPPGTPESRPGSRLYFRFQTPPHYPAGRTASSRLCPLPGTRQIQRHSLDFQKNSGTQHFYNFSLQSQGQKMSCRTAGSP